MAGIVNKVYQREKAPPRKRKKGVTMGTRLLPQTPSQGSLLLVPVGASERQPWERGCLLLVFDYQQITWCVKRLSVQRKSELSLKHLNQRLYGDNFCFEKNYPRWKPLTLIGPLHLTPLAFGNGKNNGFTTNN